MTSASTSLVEESCFLFVNNAHNGLPLVFPLKKPEIILNLSVSFLELTPKLKFEVDGLLIKFLIKLSFIQDCKLSIETPISFLCDSPKIENLSPLFQIDDTKTTTF